MWWKSFRDYPLDRPLKKEKVETQKGIVGCEMHELNGWGEIYHQKKAPSQGLFVTLCAYFFGTKVESDD